MKKLRCLCFTLLTAAALTGAASADLILDRSVRQQPPAGAGLWLLRLLPLLGVALVVAVYVHKTRQ